MGGYRAQSRKVHMDRLKNFWLLKKHKRSAIKVKTQMPDYTNHPKDGYNWKNIHGNAREKIPYYMSEAKGKEVKTTIFADASLYHDKLTGSYVTGLLIMLIGTPVD